MSVRNGLLQTLAFHHVWGHAPTRAEWIGTADVSPDVSREELIRVIDLLHHEGKIVFCFGRYAFDEETILALRKQEASIPRKRRIARQAVRWIASLSSVRFVALCNSTALGHANEESDLDFFIITRAGTLATTRIVATLPYKIFNRRPGGNPSEQDTICLSYYIADSGLDLTSHMLSPDDPYFRYWFLSLLPLYDDGVSDDLWKANSAITSRHPYATIWKTSPDLSVRPRIRLPVFSFAEPMATKIQHKAFPPTIREIMNRDSRVLVTSESLKFHVNDRREQFREQYHVVCRSHGIEYENRI
ncbi:MAG: hypothetical protein NUV81_04235 [bacterium]|nr:hypothetical protein [bacterium]